MTASNRPTQIKNALERFDFSDSELVIVLAQPEMEKRRSPLV